MGNSSSSGSGPISVAEVLRLIAQEEAEARAALPVHNGSAPGESEIAGALSALGVEKGEASVEGEKGVVWVRVRERDGQGRHVRSHQVMSW